MSHSPAEGDSQSRFSRLRSCLFAEEDIASLVYFRILFGLIMLYEVVRYFRRDWIARYFIEPTFHFKYYGFEWVHPWPGDGMYYHFAALGVLAACITIGLAYRISTVLFFLGFTYVFLLEQARYLNHFYFVCLISFLMMFIPAHRAFSIDARLFPSVRSRTAPAWGLWLLRFQMGVVYFYGGLAKLNVDWFRGEPVRTYLRNRSDDPIFGLLANHEWAVYCIAYSGVLFDLLVVPFLLWRKTRAYAFLIGILFHLTNHHLFNIGIFPWFSMGATALFFSPDWPRRLLVKIGIGRANAQQLPITGETSAPPVQSFRQGSTLVFALVMTYVAIQLLVPLRQWLYPGDVNWTDEGHRFSWRMRLRHKVATTKFYVYDPATGKTQRERPKEVLTDWQNNTMVGRPDMILQFAHYLAEEARKDGRERVEVHVESMVALNYRPKRRLIDPKVDLAAQKRSLRPAPWLLRYGNETTDEP